jgi:hypothetical protein
LKIFLLRLVLTRAGWDLARFRVAGTKAKEWSLFVYRDSSTPREALAAHLKVAPTSLSLSTLTGDPLDVEGENTSTGDALLDQALAICAERGMALPLDPEPLATLPGSPWANAKAVKNWKAGITGARVLQEGPPPGWTQVEYRLTSRRGGRASTAWVSEGIEPARAIASALGLTEAEIVVIGTDRTGAVA